MIYDNVRYKVDSFPNRPFVVLGDSHYFYFDNMEVNRYFPEQLRIDVER